MSVTILEMMFDRFQCNLGCRCHLLHVAMLATSLFAHEIIQDQGVNQACAKQNPAKSELKKGGLVSTGDITHVAHLHLPYLIVPWHTHGESCEASLKQRNYVAGACFNNCIPE